MMVRQIHQPVLLKKTIKYLDIKKNGIYVDGTLGFAGHTMKILDKLASTGHVYCFEQDINVLKKSTKILQASGYSNFTLIHSNFRYLEYELAKRQIYQIDGILLDLGLSSWHFDHTERGFSYQTNTKLDMRLDSNSFSLTAADIVMQYDQKALTKVLTKFGDEKFGHVIAKNIVEKRQSMPIKTTFALNEIIKASLPEKVLKTLKHPSKKTFQALRIAVNNELDALRFVLQQAIHLIKVQGRIAVLAFHSGEDRIVKHFFRKTINASLQRDVVSDQIGIPVLRKGTTLRSSKFKLMPAQQPLYPDPSEVVANHRSHSAKLRILLRTE